MSASSWRRNYTIGLIAAGIAAAITSGWLWTSTAALQSRIEQQASKNAYQYSQAANIAIEQECARVPPPQLAECISDEREAANEAQRNESDLEAQRIMAAWTRGMGIAAIIGMGVGIFGLGLIFTTFRETRKAAESAEKTLHSQRAWITFQRYQAAAFNRGFIDGKTAHGGLVVWLEWVNSGNSPALECSPFIKQQIVPAGAPLPVFDDDEILVSENAPSGQGQTIQTTKVAIDEVQKVGIASRKLDWYVFSRVKYRDIYSETCRISECCLKIGINGEVLRPDGTVHPNMDVGMVGSQNRVT